MSRTTLAKIAINFLEDHSFDDIPWEEFSIHPWGVTITVHNESVNVEQLRDLKRFFGPLKVDSSYRAKNLKGGCILNPDLENETEITFTLVRAYECSTLDVEDIDDDKWADLKSKIQRGLITIDDCTETKNKVEEPPPISEPKTLGDIMLEKGARSMSRQFED